MTHALPGAWSLITDSWNAFVKHWSLTVKYSAWLILAAILQEIGILFPESGMQFAVQIIGGIAGILLTLWVTVRLLQVIFTLEANQTVTEKTTATAMLLIAPMVIVGLLQGIATLGGLILLIIPGIYIGVRLCFAQLLVIDENKRGRAALVASWNMTKEKFWPIFGRSVAGGVLFAILVIVISGIAFTVVNAIAGESLQSQSNTMVFGIGIINGLIQAAFIPLATVFQIKLYNAVKKA